MIIDTVSATGAILGIFQTGDRPVIVLCDDGNHYICKYKQPAAPANKLICEFIGSCFARCWNIATPIMALVKNDAILWDGFATSHDTIAPLLGSRKMANVFDLFEMNSDQVSMRQSSLNQLLTIALFDLWIANEDRTCNNYNLLYDWNKDWIVSIDYGGIFNSGILNRPLYQLNASDSIISSDLFERLKHLGQQQVVESVEKSFAIFVKRCENIVTKVFQSVPEEWEINMSSIQDKVTELFCPHWIDETKETFENIING